LYLVFSDIVSFFSIYKNFRPERDIKKPFIEYFQPGIFQEIYKHGTENNRKEDHNVGCLLD
jgi:hypothetical protein